MAIGISIAEDASAEQVLLPNCHIEVGHNLRHLVLHLIAGKGKAMTWREVLGKGKSRGSPRDNHSVGLFQAKNVLLTIFQSNTVNSQHPQFLAQTLH